MAPEPRGQLCKSINDFSSLRNERVEDQNHRATWFKGFSPVWRGIIEG